MYVKAGDRWRYVKPVVGKNNKLRPGYAVIGGVETHVPKASYYLRYREGSKIVFRKCSSAADATVARDKQEAYLVARAHGLILAQTDTKPLPALVAEILEPWLEEYKLSHREEFYNLMKQTLEEFNGWCRKNLVAAITRYDLLRYRQWLIDRKRSQHTASNKAMRVNQFIRNVLKLREREGRSTVKDCKFPEYEPTVFNDDELAAFFKECDAYHHAIFKTYLMAGLRKQELENLEWSDVDFTAGTVTVSPKPDFTPKDWEQRTIEIPDDLLVILKDMPRRGTLVFANGSGRRYTHSWDDCAKIAKKAKVENCHPHRFRATYATRL